MKVILSLFLLLTTSSVFAQAEFLDTQTTASTPFQLPFRIGTSGNFAFLDTPDNIMVGPALGAAYSNSFVQYIRPINISKSSSLVTPISQNRGWMELRKRRYDGGLGLAAVVGDHVNVGLIPFKGAIQSTIRMKDTKDEMLPKDLLMPTELKTLESWRVGDQGSYQVYGGIEVLVALGVNIVNLARASVAFQNQFIVQLRKVNADTVIFSIAEEKLQRSESSIGPLIAKAAVQLFHGKRFSSEFALNLKDPEHHVLYEQGLKGKINLLQAKLNSKEQKLRWLGSSTAFYIGIPYLIGLEQAKGSYSIHTNGVKADLSVKTKFSRGILSTEGEHNRLVYRTDDVVLLLWNSQMKKAKDHVMNKYFFRFGRSIGLGSFDQQMPKGLYGSVQTQIGITFMKDEFLALRNTNRSTLGLRLKEKCEELRLNCRKESRRRSILKKLSQILNQPWERLSFDLGKLMLQHPALIHSILKSQRLQKDVYVKFLNDNYQSVEGMLSVEL